MIKTVFDRNWKQSQTNCNQQFRIKRFDDFWSTLPNEVMNIVVGDMQMLYLLFLGHDENLKKVLKEMCM